MTWLENAFISSLVAVVITFLLNWYKDYRYRQRKKKIYIQSLLGEIRAVLLMIGVRKKEFVLQNPGEIDNYEFVYFPISYNYFSVYESSVSNIGILENEQLINDIICSYADTKGLFENLKDIERLSRMFDEHILSNPKSEFRERLVVIHYSYCERTIKQQVPMVEMVLSRLVCELEKELQ